MVDSALAKIDRAAKHIGELSQLVLKKRPFRYILETNEKAGYCSTYAERDEGVIGEAGDIAFDIVQNLRAALDYAYFEIVSPYAVSDGERRAVQFPFSESVERLDEAIKNRLAHKVSDAFFAAIVNLQPHGEAGGNKILFAVHKLAAGERHRFPTPVADYKEFAGWELRRQAPSFPQMLDGTRIGLGNNRFGDIQWQIAANPKIRGSGVYKRELNVPVDIVFQVGALQDIKPMVPTLHAMVDVTKEAIQIIRAAE